MHQQWSRTFENSDVATQLVPVPPYACAFLRKSLLNYLIYCIYFALSRPQQIELLHVASHAFKPSQGGWTSPHSGISSTSTGRWNRCDTWRNLRSSRASPWCLGCWECRTNASPGERRRRCNLLRIMITVTSTWFHHLKFILKHVHHANDAVPDQWVKYCNQWLKRLLMIWAWTLGTCRKKNPSKTT